MSGPGLGMAERNEILTNCFAAHPGDKGAAIASAEEIEHSIGRFVAELEALQVSMKEAEKSAVALASMPGAVVPPVAAVLFESIHGQHKRVVMMIANALHTPGVRERLPLLSARIGDLITKSQHAIGRLAGVRALLLR